MDVINRRASFRRTLADWYRQAQRPLPWRTEPSLYRTVVSELMAQQTQIKTMLPYFERWMRRFPDFQSLAEAPIDAVLKHWEGLGYYSRARNLHKLAQTYVSLDTKPVTAKEWQALPGIGPYTAAAISSIALGQPAAVVDGNVVRILARITNDQRTFSHGGQAVKSFTPTADTLLDPAHPGDHNQAMMELGATICLKHRPLCTLCPVAEFCAARQEGTPEQLPRIQRKATVRVEIDRLWAVRDGAILLHRIPETASQLAGHYELPELHTAAASGAPAHLLTTKTRSITHRRITERIHSAPAAQPPGPDLHWVSRKELDQITLSGPHRRWVRELWARETSKNS